MAAYIPRDLDFAETAPIQIEAVEVVDGSRQEVWDVLLDYPGWTTWFAALTDCHATSDPATGIGSTRRVKLTGGSTFDEEFIGWDEPALWSFTGISGPPIFAGLVERVTLVELSPTRTQVTYRMAIEPRRGLSPFIKASRRLIQKNLATALRELGTVVAGNR